MLIQFKVGNFLSFKEEVTFSMVCDDLNLDNPTNHKLYNFNSNGTHSINLLKSAVLYGANGSGKSNLIKAIQFFKKYIINSSKDTQVTDKTEIIKFLLSSDTDEIPSTFEMIFISENVRYRYGFAVDINKVHSEWLFSLNGAISSKETKLFIREFQEIKPNNIKFREGKGLENKTRPNALYLSTVAQFNGAISTELIKWFTFQLQVISALNDNNYLNFTIEKYQKEERFRIQLIEFFKSIQIGFDNIEIVDKDKYFDKLGSEQGIRHALISDVFESNGDKPNNTIINLAHRKYDNNSEFLEFVNIDYGLESKGTQKLFNLLGIWIDSIENGRILIVDELDCQLHSLLSIELIKLFNSNTNRNAQLVFTSHDTNLLKKELFRRDQIWFTEKNNIGATDLYSLDEFNIRQATLSSSSTYENSYLLGKYGAIPFVGNIQKFTNEYLNYEIKE